MKKQKTADVIADQLKSEGDSVVNEPEKKQRLEYFIYIFKLCCTGAEVGTRGREPKYEN